MVAGLLKDGINGLARNGMLGEAMNTDAAGYMVVYQIEILLLFVCLAIIGPLSGRRYARTEQGDRRFGLAEMPG